MCRCINLFTLKLSCQHRYTIISIERNTIFLLQLFLMCLYLIILKNQANAILLWIKWPTILTDSYYELGFF